MFWLLFVWSFNVRSAEKSDLTQPSEVVAWPSKGLLLYVVAHLDVTTFRNSIGPRREPGKSSLHEYGFNVIHANELNADLINTSINWRMHFEMIKTTDSYLLICFDDQAINGGTYHTRNLIKVTPSGHANLLLGIIDKQLNIECPYLGE